MLRVMICIPIAISTALMWWKIGESGATVPHDLPVGQGNILFNIPVLAVGMFMVFSFLAGIIGLLSRERSMAFSWGALIASAVFFMWAFLSPNVKTVPTDTSLPDSTGVMLAFTHLGLIVLHIVNVLPWGLRRHHEA